MHNRCGFGGNGQGFASQRWLDRHFVDHGHEFTPPFINAADYEQAAVDFMQGLMGPNIYQGVRSNGDIIRFNEVTNEFGIARSDGVIRTYYISDPARNFMSNWEYVLRQIW